MGESSMVSGASSESIGHRRDRDLDSNEGPDEGELMPKFCIIRRPLGVNGLDNSAWPVSPSSLGKERFRGLDVLGEI